MRQFPSPGVPCAIPYDLAKQHLDTSLPRDRGMVPRLQAFRLRGAPIETSEDSFCTIALPDTLIMKIWQKVNCSPDRPTSQTTRYTGEQHAYTVHWRCLTSLSCPYCIYYTSVARLMNFHFTDNSRN